METENLNHPKMQLVDTKYGTFTIVKNNVFVCEVQSDINSMLLTDI